MKLSIGACSHNVLPPSEPRTYEMCQTQLVRRCHTREVAYETDILDDFAARSRGPVYPDVPVEMG
ncbi:MAG TPA: hypothetical protein VK853_02160, partial [Ilumatobacteraceae bacterium]|nr:hypothetical protein [Ilumatobacteraceae bacterium]